MKPILSVRGLNKIFPNGVHALNDVSFDVQEGEFLVVIGLSGSGKSTLLRCLNRLYDPTSGEIHFHSTRVDQVQGRQLLALRRQIAMIFQSFNLVPRSTVLINVLSGRLARIPTWRSLCKFFSPAERESALKRLDLVGLREKAAQRADQLSGGQQQRVAIARAL
ncbi:MAG TPA: ATP-binding cassette domain-containing protein, partial [Bdellovibrionales bacterium]|nr:ATP-binding cassette domain-containing protein [Bdellovibrionales bacterium]